jgi:hypothetical protein
MTNSQGYSLAVKIDGQKFLGHLRNASRQSFAILLDLVLPAHSLSPLHFYKTLISLD